MLYRIITLPFSTTNTFLQDATSPNSAPQSTNSESKEIEWKKNVVVVPIATTVEDLKKTHKLVKDGFYVSHRIYVEKMPEKYTIEPIPTKRTGGYDIETSNLE